LICAFTAFLETLQQAAIINILNIIAKKIEVNKTVTNKKALLN